MKKVEILLSKEHLELLIESVSNRVVKGNSEEMKKLFVTNEKFYYSCLGLVVFLLISYCGLTWKNPNMINNIQGVEQIATPVKTN